MARLAAPLSGAAVSDEQLVAMATTTPARMLGWSDHLGSLEAGKRANLIVLDGMPFHTKTRVVTELVGGRVVDLSNHQTELYKFYKTKYGID